MLISSCVVWRYGRFDDFRRECPAGDPALQRLVWERPGRGARLARVARRSGRDPRDGQSAHGRRALRSAGADGGARSCGRRCPYREPARAGRRPARRPRHRRLRRRPRAEARPAPARQPLERRRRDPVRARARRCGDRRPRGVLRAQHAGPARALRRGGLRAPRAALRPARARRGRRAANPSHRIHCRGRRPISCSRLHSGPTVGRGTWSTPGLSGSGCATGPSRRWCEPPRRREPRFAGLILSPSSAYGCRHPPSFASRRSPRSTCRRAITHTIGGLRVDTAARVLTSRVEPIAGLFAAGADVGGISTGGYASGLASALVLGLVAAESSSDKSLLRDYPCR